MVNLTSVLYLQTDYRVSVVNPSINTADILSRLCKEGLAIEIGGWISDTKHLVHYVELKILRTPPPAPSTCQTGRRRSQWTPPRSPPPSPHHMEAPEVTWQSSATWKVSLGNRSYSQKSRLYGQSPKFGASSFVHRSNSLDNYETHSRGTRTDWLRRNRRCRFILNKLPSMKPNRKLTCVKYW